METERLQKFLSRAGVASRRHAEEMIAEGRIKVNGVLITQPGTQVSEKDQVFVDGKLVKPAEQLVYYVLNKPKGIITSSADELGRKTVLNLVPANPRVVACGRLDASSHGLVILTNDGDFCYQLTQPKFSHEKEYQVTATINKGPALEERIKRLEQGVKLDDGITRPTIVKDVSRQGMRLSFTIILREGKNRQVRRMCSAVGLDIVDLYRTRMASITLSDTPEGRWRRLTKAELPDLTAEAV